MLTESGDYAIWTDVVAATEASGGPASIFVSVTDGNKSWDCFLEERDIPLPRRTQGWTYHVSVLLSALRMDKIDGSGASSEFTLEQGSLMLTVTERIQGTTLRSLLLKRSLAETSDAKASMRNVLLSSAKLLAANKFEILRLQDKVTTFSRSVSQLQQNLDDVAEIQDGLQTEMMRNMCIVLNSKSSEIRFLRSTLSIGDHNRDLGVATNSEVTSLVTEPLRASPLKRKREHTKPKKREAAATGREIIAAVTYAEEIDTDTEICNPSVSFPMKIILSQAEDCSSTGCGQRTTPDSIISVILDNNIDITPASIINITSDSTIVTNPDITVNSVNNLPNEPKQSAIGQNKKRNRKLDDSSDESEPEEVTLS